MSKYNKTTEARILENYRVALENALDIEEIYQALSEHGYDRNKIYEGRQLFDRVYSTWEKSQNAKADRNKKHEKFRELKKEQHRDYIHHRKKAKIIFRKEWSVVQLLGLNRPVKRTYREWMNEMNEFYSNIKKNLFIVSGLARLNFREEHMKAAYDLIIEVEKSRGEYLLAKQTASNIIELKKTALSELNGWMSDFHAIAKIALYGNPKLLEKLWKKDKPDKVRKSE